MVKQDIVKSLVAILVIIVLAVLIVNVNRFISPKVPQKAEEKQDVLSERSVVDYSGCFSNSPGTVVFIHSNSCPHCVRMKPVIEELEGEGYSFYSAESSDTEAREIISSCLSDMLSGYVPQFVCPSTGVEKTGSMSKEELKAFADSCA